MKFLKILCLTALLISASKVQAQPNPTALDPSYGQKGIAHIPGYYDVSMLQQPDDKLLLFASRETLGKQYLEILRFNRDGHPDKSFGRGGKVVTGIVAVLPMPGQLSTAIDKLGRIYVPTRKGVARFKSDGRLDFTWGVKGIAALSIPLGVALQSNGKVIVLVFPHWNPKTNFTPYLVRLDSHGNRDASFHRIDFPSDRMISAIFMNLGVRPVDDSILISASARQVSVKEGESPRVLAMWHYGKNGQPDTKFGDRGEFGWAGAKGINGGPRITLNSNYIDVLTGCDPFPGQGSAQSIHEGKRKSSDVALFRVNWKGQLDPNFGTTPTGPLDFGGSEFVNSMAAFPDGTHVASLSYLPDQRTTKGFEDFKDTTLQSQSAIFLRLDRNGKVDPNFGVNRKPLTLVVGATSMAQLAVQSGGRILVLAGDNNRFTPRFRGGRSGCAASMEFGHRPRNNDLFGCAAPPFLAWQRLTATSAT